MLSNHVGGQLAGHEAGLERWLVGLRVDRLELDLELLATLGDLV